MRGWIVSEHQVRMAIACGLEWMGEDHDERKEPEMTGSEEGLCRASKEMARVGET
jgi:hypothetical protein